MVNRARTSSPATYTTEHTASHQPLEVVADLEDELDIERLFSSALDHFNQRLDLLVNNAGFGRPVSHTRPEECYDAFKQIMRINLNAVVKLTLLAIPVLKRTSAELSQGSCSIVNIGSISAMRPVTGLASYGVSKAALHTYTNCMAVELAPEIRVNCVSPGPIETKIIERSGWSLDAWKEASKSKTPLARVGQPEEVAQCVLFLADPLRAGYVTGANLVVDGGTSLAQIQLEQ